MKKNNDKKKEKKPEDETVYCCGIPLRKGGRCQICGDKYED